MKSKFLVLVFAVVLAVGISAWAFGAGGQVQQVQMQPLVNFDGFFENITEWFTDILKKYWVMLLSVFFVLVLRGYVLVFLETRQERIRRERRVSAMVERGIEREEANERLAAHREVARRYRERERENQEYIRRFEQEEFYHNLRSRQGMTERPVVFFADTEAAYQGKIHEFDENFSYVTFGDEDYDSPDDFYGQGNWDSDTEIYREVLDCEKEQYLQNRAIGELERYYQYNSWQAIMEGYAGDPESAEEIELSEEDERIIDSAYYMQLEKIAADYHERKDEREYLAAWDEVTSTYKRLRGGY